NVDRVAQAPPRPKGGRMSAPLTAVELFAGAGGLALGTEKAGFKHALLAERDRAACATLRLNRPGWTVKEGDARDVDFTGYRGVDLIAGGPPCQSFSAASRARRGSTRRRLLREHDPRNMFPAAVQAI